MYRHASPGVGAPGAATIRTSAGSPPPSTAFIAATPGGNDSDSGSWKNGARFVASSSCGSGKACESEGDLEMPVFDSSSKVALHLANQGTRNSQSIASDWND